VNTWQAVRRLKNILRGIQWGTTGGRLFARNSVFASGGPSEAVLDQVRLPAAWVNAGSMTADDMNPGLYTADLEIVTLVSVPGDAYGERVLMGSNRASATESVGRGLFEIEKEMLGAIKHLDASDQFRIMLRAASSALPVSVGSEGFFATRRYIMTTLLTMEDQHLHPRKVSASNASGTVTVSWTAPDDVTNFVDYVVRRTSGTIPAAFPTDGTAITWSSGTSVTDTPGSGTWTYSVFARYDDEGGSFALDASDYDDDTVVV